MLAVIQKELKISSNLQQIALIPYQIYFFLLLLVKKESKQYINQFP